MATQIRQQKSDISHSSTPELFTGLIADARELAVGHLGRMQHEISGEFSNLKQYLARVAMAVGVVVVGAVLVGITLAQVLIALGLPTWAGYAIAAVLMLGTGLLLIKRMPGEKKNMDLIPDAALARMKTDVRHIKDEAQQDTREAATH